MMNYSILTRTDHFMLNFFYILAVFRVRC